MNLDRFKRLINSYLDGKLPLHEKEQVDNWFNSISNEDVSPFKNANSKRRIKADILSRIPNHIYQTAQPTLFRRPLFLSIAASIILVCTIGLLFFNRNHLNFFQSKNTSSITFDQVYTGAGEMKKYILPDSSSIWLGGNARIHFHRASYAKNRKIYLDRGEAFFDVQRDPRHPFAIETGGVSIKVLGTSFNVKNSKQQKRVTIDVKTGKVQVTDHKGKSQHLLTKGKSLQYDTRGKVFRLFNSEPGNADLWTKGGLILDNATFGELKELMFNRYGLSLRSEKLDTKKLRYSILMPYMHSVTDLLSMIGNIHQIKYRRENDEIILYK